MERIRIHDIRVREEIEAVTKWFRAETQEWLRYIDQEDQKTFRKDDTWNDLVYIVIYAFRLYGHSKERVIRMAGLLCLLRCSGHLHDRIQDGAEEPNPRKASYLLLVGDQIMARALQLLAEDEAFVLIPYFARIVVRMSEGMVRYTERSQIDLEILDYTHASWYEAAFYSAACLAGQTDLQQKRAGRFGWNLGMFLESSRQGLALTNPRIFYEADWETLPDGWEKQALMQFTKAVSSVQNQRVKEKVYMTQ